MSRNRASPPPDTGDDWDTLWNLLTPDEQAKNNIKIALLDEIINTRLKSDMTQK
jgi:hypothetical protein